MWDVSIFSPTSSLNHGRSTPVGIHAKETTTIFCPLPECALTMFLPSPPQPCQEPLWGPCEHPQSCRSWEPACEALRGKGKGSGCLRGAEQPHCSSDGAQPPAAHRQQGDVLPAGNWGCKSGCPHSSPGFPFPAGLQFPVLPPRSLAPRSCQAGEGHLV